MLVAAAGKLGGQAGLEQKLIDLEGIQDRLDHDAQLLAALREFNHGIPGKRPFPLRWRGGSAAGKSVFGEQFFQLRHAFFQDVRLWIHEPRGSPFVVYYMGVFANLQSNTHDNFIRRRGPH